MWLDIVQLTGLDDGRKHCPVLCASIMTREERVFAVQRDRAHATLDNVTVNLDATVGQEEV